MKIYGLWIPRNEDIEKIKQTGIIATIEKIRIVYDE